MRHPGVSGILVGAAWVASALTTSAFGGAGCGGSDGEAPQVGDVVWDASVSALVVSSEGGGLLPTPPGSACNVGSAEHTLRVSELRITSWSCEGSPGSPYAKVQRERAITAAQLTELSSSLEKLQVVDAASCGADKPAITLKVTRGGATREYRDSFYGCLSDPRPQVDSDALSEVFGRLGLLAAGA
jgi:hypothetical protein